MCPTACALTWQSSSKDTKAYLIPPACWRNSRAAAYVTLYTSAIIIPFSVVPLRCFYTTKVMKGRQMCFRSS